MVTPWAPTLLAVGIISLVSLVGLLTIPFHVLRRHGVLFALIAVAAGTLLGDAFFHLLPEAVELWGGFELSVGLLVVAGFLVFYLLESGLRIGHAHGEAEHTPHDGTLPVVRAPLPHAAAAGARPKAIGRPATPAAAIQPFGVLNLVADALHNFLDGIVVAAAFFVDTPTGIATAVAVAVHEIPQEFGDFGVLVRAGLRPLKAAAFNLLGALFAFAGAGLLLVLGAEFDTETMEQFALPIVAGGFIYIAAADLVPELHHHARARYIPAVVAFLVLGLGLMVGLTFLEPGA